MFAERAGIKRVKQEILVEFIEPGSKDSSSS